MRPICLAAPGLSAAEHYRAIRDKPAYQRTAKLRPDQIADMRAPAPPSAAHKRRLAMADNGMFRDPAPAALAPKPEAVQNYYRVIAALGGSRTIVGVDEPHNPPREPGTATTLERHAAEAAERQRANDAVAARRHARANAAWRAVATGQGELSL